MGREKGEPSDQRRQKRHHDPNIQRQEASPPIPPLRELCPRQCAGKGQGDLPTSCKADLLLLHLVLIQQGEVLLGKFVPELHQSCNRSSQLSKDSIQGFLSLLNLAL